MHTEFLCGSVAENVHLETKTEMGGLYEDGCL